MTSLQIVQSVRANYPTPLGVTHWTFLNEVASRLSLGLVRKLEGTSVLGVSPDVVMDHQGNAWDILVDSEGLAVPAFNPSPKLDPSKYVEPEHIPLPPVEAPDDPETPDQESSQVYEMLRLIVGALEDLEDRLLGIEDKLLLIEQVLTSNQVKFPAYVGALGFKLRLTPEPEKK